LQSAPRVRHSTYSPPVLAVVLDPLRMADGNVATVLTIKDDMCKFPIGDPAEADFAFCGRPSCVGPYCLDHARLTYQPSYAKRRRPEEIQPQQSMLRLAV
jgi:GcrA cell cycle regulator